MKPEEIAKLIKDLRLDMRMTQGLFADFLGTSAKTVSRWEIGSSQPHPAMLQKIIRYKKSADKVKLREQEEGLE